MELKGVHILRVGDVGELIDIDPIARPAKGVMALGNAIGAKADALRTQTADA